MLQCKSVLITGSTGFLGIHIINELMNKTSCTVYCLARGRNIEDIKERFIQILNFYSMNELVNLIDSRIILLKGDITQEFLGMECETYDLIGRKVSIIIHGGAVVKHFGLYDTFKKVNEGGTEKVIQFALKYGIYVAHISSIAVAEYQPNTLNSEKFYEKYNRLKSAESADVYVKSKVKAEEIFNNAKSNGLRGSIFRIGTLTGRKNDGCFQVNMKENALYSRIIVILKSKILPGQILSESLEFTPVDCCCEAFVKIMCDMPEEIFHLSNDNTITYQELLEILKELDVIVDKKEKLDFLDYMNHSQQFGIREELYIGFYMHLKRNAKCRAQLQYDYTKQYLSNKGFYWPKIDKDYIEKVINYISNYYDRKSLINGR